MAKRCPYCKSEISTTTTICPNCGRKVKSQNNIAGLLGLVIVISILIILSFNGILASNETVYGLETYDFGNFTMLVPEGSSFIEYDYFKGGDDFWAVGYDNTLENDYKLSDVWVANYNRTNLTQENLIDNDGDLEIYNSMFNKSYIIQKEVGDFYVTVIGIDDLETLKEIANSITLKNETAES